MKGLHDLTQTRSDALCKAVLMALQSEDDDAADEARNFWVLSGQQTRAMLKSLVDFFVVIWGCPARHGGTKIAGWFRRENPIKMDG